MAFVPKSKDQLVAQLMSSFAEQGFDNVVSGTPEHALVYIFAEELANLHEEANTALNNNKPMNATGTLLDLWAGFFDQIRQTSSYAEDATTSNVYFYIPSAQRSNVNGGDAVTIPIGTTITDSDGVRTYVTTAEATIPASAPYIGFVPVKAKVAGSFLNVDANELTVHDFTDTEGYAYIEVSNKFALSNGSLTQTDYNLQVQLQSIFGKALRTNLEGIETKLASLAGVSDVQLLSARRGTGTFNVFIDSTTPIITPALIDQAQALVDQECAVGVQGYVEYPTYKAISITFDVLAKDGVDADALLLTLAGDPATEVMNEINNISRGGTFDPIVSKRIISYHEDVLDVSISELKIGEYSITSEKVINSVTCGLGKRSLGDFEKWFTSTDLINFCKVEYE